MTNYPSLDDVPPKAFSTIVADPPWPYGDSLPGKKRGASTHYGLMTRDDIKALPVSALAADKAHLYLWTPGAFMPEAFETARAWGFDPKQVLTWVKTKKGISHPRLDDESDLRMGMGWNYRNCAEFILFATRGRLRTNHQNVLSVFFAPRQDHSAKPPRFQTMVEAQSPGPYLEMFAREARPGWATWGDEAPEEVSV